MPKVRLNDKSIRKAAPAAGQVELWDDIIRASVCGSPPVAPEPIS